MGQRERVTPPFPPRTLSFLRALKRHNDRTWFAAHKEDYVRDVQQPMLEFVEWVAGQLRAFDPDLVGTPKVSLFRIYRDTRFSADKTPFKTQVGAVFPHRALHRNVSACLYAEVGPSGTLIAGGIYRPDRPQLLAIREHVAANHQRLRTLLQAPGLKRALGDIEGDPLQRVPPGYPPDHPAAEYLKFRHFLLAKEYPAAFATSPAFPREVLRLFRHMAPLVAYLNEPLLAADASRDPLAAREPRRDPKRLSQPME